MKTLVTGGAGFIGSNLVDALVGRGDDVAVIDDVSTGKRANLEQALANGAELIELDVRDADAVAAAVGSVRPELIFHLAAQIDVRRSVADPAYDSRVNVEGTINVLSAAQASGVRRVVNTSTGGAIYGEAQIIPAPEEHPVTPEAPYGLSKFCAENYCALFTRLHGLSTISLRYGGRPTIYGDGTQTRDYVYVGDVVDANLCAADSERTGSYNVGRGVETSVLDIVNALAAHSDDGFEADHAPPRPGEVQHIALDTSRTRQELGWQAQVDLDQGLARTLDSLR